MTQLYCIMFVFVSYAGTSITLSSDIIQVCTPAHSKDYAWKYTVILVNVYIYVFLKTASVGSVLFPFPSFLVLSLLKQIYCSGGE